MLQRFSVRTKFVFQGCDELPAMLRAHLVKLHQLGVAVFLRTARAQSLSGAPLTPVLGLDVVALRALGVVVVDRTFNCVPWACLRHLSSLRLRPPRLIVRVITCWAACGFFLIYPVPPPHPEA